MSRQQRPIWRLRPRQFTRQHLPTSLLHGGCAYRRCACVGSNGCTFNGVSVDDRGYTSAPAATTADAANTNAATNVADDNAVLTKPVGGEAFARDRTYATGIQ